MATNPDDTVGSSLDDGVQLRSTPEQVVSLSNAAANQADEGRLQRTGLNLIDHKRVGLANPGGSTHGPNGAAKGTSHAVGLMPSYVIKQASCGCCAKCDAAMMKLARGST